MQASRKIINEVTRDVSKALDKAWHEGLRIKTHTQCQLPSLTIKLLLVYEPSSISCTPPQDSMSLV